jgi:hypothetical protein
MSGWKDRARQTAKQRAEGEFWKPSTGMNTVRIMPNVLGLEEPPWLDFMVHRDVGKDGRVVTCGKDFTTGKGKCWIHDVLIPKLLATAVKAHHLAAEKMAAQKNCIFQISPVVNGKFEAPRGWWMSVGGAKAISTQLLNKLGNSKYSFDDPIKGRNLNFTRTGTDINTVYGAFEADDDATRVPQAILAQIKPLTDLISPYSEEDQKEAYYGKEEEAAPPVDEEEPPAEGEEVPEGEGEYEEVPEGDEVAEEVAEGTEEIVEGEYEEAQEGEEEAEVLDEDSVPEGEEDVELPDEEPEPEEEPEPVAVAPVRRAPPKPAPAPAKKPASVVPRPTQTLPRPPAKPPAAAPRPAATPVKKLVPPAATRPALVPPKKPLVLPPPKTAAAVKK